MRANQVLVVVSVALLLSLFGCRAKPAPDSGFLDDTSKMRKDRAMPFAKAYFPHEFYEPKYTRIYVAPVNTKYVMAQNTWESLNESKFLSKDSVAQSIDNMAQYMQDSFKKAAAADPKKHYAVVDQPGEGTIVLELALVQLVPSKAALNAAGIFSWIPTAVEVAGSKLSDSEDVGKGVVAIEARVRDAATGEIVAMFADRENPPTALLDLKSLSWWAPCKKTVDDWSRQFIEVSNNHGRKVADSKRFKLLIW